PKKTTSTVLTEKKLDISEILKEISRKTDDKIKKILAKYSEKDTIRIMQEYSKILQEKSKTEEEKKKIEEENKKLLEDNKKLKKKIYKKTKKKKKKILKK